MASNKPSSKSKESMLDRLLKQAHAPADLPAVLEKYKDPLLTHATVQEPPKKKVSSQQKNKNRKTLSAKQKRKLGLLKLPGPEAAHWDFYAELRKLWMGYAREVLFGTKDGWVPVEQAGSKEKSGASVGVSQELAAKVAAMEFSGAEVSVVRCKNVQRVGIKGTIVREGRGTFWICKREGGWAVLPKEGAVVRVEVEPPEGVTEKGAKNVVFNVFGDGIICRPAERANRKFKGRLVVD